MLIWGFSLHNLEINWFIIDLHTCRSGLAVWQVTKCCACTKPNALLSCDWGPMWTRAGFRPRFIHCDRLIYTWIFLGPPATSSFLSFQTHQAAFLFVLVMSAASSRNVSAEKLVGFGSAILFCSFLLSVNWSIRCCGLNLPLCSVTFLRETLHLSDRFLMLLKINPALYDLTTRKLLLSATAANYLKNL